MRKPRVMVGADSLKRGASGIARVARLVTKVLAEEADAGRLEAAAVALSDDRPAADLGIPVRSAVGSRARFAYEIHRAALACSHFIYDFAGVARAHPRTWPLARPTLVWAHGIDVWEEARRDRLSRARSAAVLLTNSAYTAARMTALHAGLSHAQTCWLATEEDTPAARSLETRPPAALILSRLDAGGGYKGHRELIASWPAVLAAVPGARLLIAGDGPGMPVLRELVESSPARRAIELLGFAQEAALDALWNRSTVFAMPSRGEGFGLAYIEAMRHRVPVIASIHDAGSEINLDGVTGLNVDLDRPAALTEALVRVLADAALAERLGAAAQTRWTEHFRYDCFRARFLPILREFVSS
jgi:phosphatidylinositol alpha-1,6-mannosyltransferase